MCQSIHSTVYSYSEKYLNEMRRYNYVTPTSYLELLGIFAKLIGLKKNELVTARNRTKTGLDKVSEHAVTADQQRYSALCFSDYLTSHRLRKRGYGAYGA